MTVQPPFETFDHTADVGIIARGAGLAEAFASAAKAMFSLMVDLGRVEPRDERRIEVEAEDVEGLLVGWLAELLYVSEVDNLVFNRFDVDEISDTRIVARAFGEPLDLDRHNPKLMVKAVTRHMLEVAPESGGYRVRVILDI
ncbi:MAG TPA: archease [Dehalococcoidia bacterium]|nr:archease [Dehalococcoidia bacterium]